MKKTLSLIFAFVLTVAITLGLASCGNDVEFNVKFIVDGEVYATVGTNGEETIKIPENPTKDGYIFDGWYWDNGAWQKPFTANSLLDAPLSSDMSVYAKWNCSHSSSDWIIDKEAACNQAGSKHKECTKCGEVLETAAIDKLTTHTPAEAVTENFVDSTCKAEGSYDEVVYCSVCGVEIIRTAKTVAKKTTHTPAEAVTENFVDSTCKVEGSYDEVVYCSVCGVEISRTAKTVAKKTTHTPAEAVTENFVDSTCKVEGSYDEVVYCSVCGIEISRTAKTVAKKTTHTPAEAVTENFVDSTCKVEGSYDDVVYCSVCGVEISRTAKTVAKKTTHTPAEAVTENFVDSTCKVEGSYDEVVYCSVCGVEISRTAKTVAKKTTHTPAEAVTENFVDSTCKVEGSYDEVVYCSVCGTEISRTAKNVAKKTTHTPAEAVTENFVDSTCKVEGSYDEVVYCSVCGVEISRTAKTVAKKTTHTPAEAVIENFVDSTCKVEGSYDEVVYCSVCGTEISRTVKTVAKKTTHTPAEAVTENFIDSTCKVEGSYDEVVYCSVCGTEISRTAKTVAKKTTHTPAEAVTENFVDSTCKVEGSYDEVVYCSVCGTEISRTAKTVAKKTTHTPAEAVTENFVDSTCKVEGSYDEVVYCSVCNVRLTTEGKTIEKKPHTVVIDKAVAPDCTNTGLTEGKHCSVCDTVLIAQTVVPATGHSFGEWYITKEPTEAESGAKRRDCKNCDEFETDVVAPLSHDHARWETITLEAVAPTCTETGLTEGKKCSGCGEILVAQETVKVLGHNEIPHAAKAPTCTEIGWDAYVTCSRCDYSTYVEKPALTHDEIPHDAKAPTCTEIGWDAYVTCSRCDYTTYVEKAALTHDEIKHDAKAPTCTEIGWDAYVTCSRCDYTTYVEKAALTHDEVKHDAKAPTCTEIGWDAYVTCSRCDYTTYVEKAALTHDEVKHDAKAPTCTEIGWDAYVTCSRCDYTTYAEKPALTHDEVKHDAKAPTCTAIGWDAYVTCSRCDYTTYAEKAALTHDEVKHDAKAPTCTEIGWDAYVTCSRCDYTTYAPIEETGHSHNAVVTKPTCTEKGCTTHICHCGDTYVDTYVDALGHTEVTDEAVAPTCTNTGLTEGSHCSACGEVFTAQNSIDALGHIEHNYDGKAATCTEFGWEAYFICEREGCGYSSYKEIAALGHDEIHHAEIPATCQAVGYSSYVTCSRCDYHTNSVELPIVDHLFVHFECAVPIDYYYCIHSSYYISYCEYGCGERINTIKESGPHKLVIDAYYVAPGLDSYGYYNFEISCEHCETVILDRTLYITYPDGSGTADKNLWLNNALLKDVPYPDNVTVDTLVLDKANDQTMNPYYGYAGGYFKANNTANIQSYLSKIRSSAFSHNATLTNASYVGYNSSGSLMLAVGFVGTDLTVMVYKVKDVTIGGGSNESHLHDYHSYTVAPTCTQRGFTIYYCYCGEYYGTWVPPHAHSKNCTILPTVAPTCTETGLTQGRYCNDCGKTVVEQKEIAALGHVDENGYCSRCNELTEYTITFVADGITVSTITYTVETDKITPPDVPEKIGHTGVWDSFELGTSSFTVEAIYTRNTYNISYVMGAGTNHKDNPANYTFGDSIELLTPTTSEPLVIFGGWFTDPAFYVESAISEISPETYGDITLYAQWIYYRIETATGFEIDYNAEMPTLRIRVPSSSDRFDFKGKITVSKNCTWKVYADEYASISYDMKLVPITDSNNVYYIVVFHPDGEYYTQYRVEIYRRESYTYEYRDFVGNVIASGNYDEDSELPSATPPVYDGFTFVGWSDGEKIVEENAVPDKNIVLTPVYSANYRVEYYLENVDKTDYELLAAGEAEGLTNEIMIAEVIEIPHFTFNSDKSVISGSFSVTDELVLKVYYTRNTYKIIATTSNGTVTCAGDHPYGALVDLTTQGYPGYELSAITVDGEDVFDYIDYKILIEGDVYVEAEFTVKPEMERFNFTSTAATCTITGIKDKTVTEIIVPDYVTSIGSSAFYDCTSLTSVTIGEGVTSIGNRAFYNCTALEKIYFNATEMNDLSSYNDVFSYAGQNGDGIKVVIGKNVTKIPACLFYPYSNSSYSPKITSVEFEEGSVCESIGKCAFSCCTSLTSITIPDSVTSIGNSAFSGCNSLTSIIIPDSVTSIGGSAFSGCSSLVRLTIPFVGGNKSATSASSSTLFGYIFGSSSYTGGVNTSQYYSSSSSSYTPYCIPSSLKSVTVTGGNIFYGAFRGCNSLTSVTIPNSVTSIGDYAFYNCTSLTSITIPDSVTSIGNFAFSGCKALEEIYFNATAMNDLSSSNYVFYNAGKDGNGIRVVIGANVTKIPAYLFYPYSNSSYSPKITSVEFEEGSVCTSIGSYVFSGCTSLTSVTIPDSVTSIDSYAFDNCESLTSITIPDGVTSIGSSAFYNCTSLTSVYITDIAKWCGISFGNSSSNPLAYAHNLYLNGELVTELEIPDSVTSIGRYAFENCTSLTSITIPDSVTSIGRYAFENCTSLTSITIPDSVTEIGHDAFGYCRSLTSITIPDSVTSIGNYAFSDCTALEEIYFNAVAMNDLSSDNYVFYNAGKDGNGIKVVIGANVTKIPAYLFYPYSNSSYSPKIISVEFKEGGVCESIGSHAFYYCTSLTSVTIPDSVETIGEYAFAYCPNLSELTLGNSIEHIGSYAFRDCTSLTSVSIPDSVTSIGDSAFYHCYKLVEVINHSSLDITAGNSSNGYAGYYAIEVHKGESKIVNYNDYLFYIYNGVNYLLGYVGNDKDLVLPESYKGENYEICKYAFYGCTRLTSIEIPDSVTSIGKYAFYSCDSLTSVTIPNSVTSIGGSAFSACDSLTSVTIPDSVTSIGDWAFHNCKSLTSITIPDSVETIGEYAFAYCSNLSELTLGNSIEHIGSYAFYNCTSLVSVTIPNSVTSIGSYVFYGCTSLTIYCEAASKPSVWNSDWNYSGCPVVWGYEG